jgi:subfamily B ATP-binding cassette protein MsbA
LLLFAVAAGCAGSHGDWAHHVVVAPRLSTIRNADMILYWGLLSLLPWLLLHAAVLQDALDRMVAGRTTVVVAHWLSTIRNADMIFS